MLANYAYFWGDIVLVFFWIIIFLYRRDLRKEMLFGGILGIPFGLSHFLFIPEYWDPQTLFNLTHKIGFGIEDIIFGFVAGSVASVIFEVMNRKKLVKIKRYKHQFVLYILLLTGYFFLELASPGTTMYNLVIAISLGALWMIWKRKDLIPQALASSALFTFFYISLFALFIRIPIYRNFIETVYTTENLLGISVFGIPIEEVFLGFAVGAAWSVFYEFIMGYRTRKIPHYAG